MSTYLAGEIDDRIVGIQVELEIARQEGKKIRPKDLRALKRNTSEILRAKQRLETLQALRDRYH